MANGNTLALKQERFCSRCDIKKDLDEFYKSKLGKYGRRSICISCDKNYSKEWASNNPEKRREYGRIACRKHSDKRKVYYRFRSYGITKEEFDEMVRKQNGRCAICWTEPNGKRPLVVDHNHTNGQVRGLLCVKCNWSLERVESVPGWTIIAEAYLETAPNLWDEHV